MGKNSLIKDTEKIPSLFFLTECIKLSTNPVTICRLKKNLICILNNYLWIEGPLLSELYGDWKLICRLRNYLQTEKKYQQMKDLSADGIGICKLKNYLQIMFDLQIKEQSVDRVITCRSKSYLRNYLWME